ncbi:MAG: hypothetical protein ACYDHN_08000 [Solirubrobacteraceae bacterium]
MLVEGASTWETVAQIATTIGALAAAGTLGAGFLLYRLNRRDEDLAALRMTIAASRANVDRLRSMVGYELADELVTAAVYSRSMSVPLQNLFRQFFSNGGAAPDDRTKKIKEALGYITVAINSPIAHDFEDRTRAISSDAARYQTSYPGLYRVLRALAALYLNVLEMEKQVARDEETWTRMLDELVDDKSAEIHSLDDLLYRLSSELIGGSTYLASEVRKELGDLGEILDLVADAYLVQDEASLVRLSRAERGEELTPVSRTKTITEDLREAEKALQHVLTKDDRLKYREIVTRFDNRRSNESE